ncbi:hypothetical protein BH10CHL1_BH10CHL1_44540 [soil metagenome]
MIDESRWESHLAQEPESPGHWFTRTSLWSIEHFRPDLGWTVLATCLLLALLPTWALGENRLDELRRIQAGVDSVGPLAVLTTWLLLGWRHPRRFARARKIRSALNVFVLLLIGFILITQILTGWLPSLQALWQALLYNGWSQLVQASLAAWVRLFTHFALWWQGVQSGGAAQDNLIFAAFAGAIFWIIGALTAWLARRYWQGILAAAPVLWLVGTILIYSRPTRSLMILGVLLAIILQVLLDQQRLTRRWQASRLDFSGGLFLDRILIVAVACIVFLLLATFIPNWYISPIVDRYYQLIEPWQQNVETWRDRLFPDLEGVSGLHGGGIGGGLPNNFLLGNSGGLNETEVMRVRTNDYVDAGGPFYEQAAPPGHYMRGATYAVYNGHGWSNPPETQRHQYTANETWDLQPLKGRQALVQNVTLAFNSSILYGAPEQMEPGLDYEAELRADGDLITLWAREQSYTIVSSIPAVSEEQLASVPAWDDQHPLPVGYGVDLQLPTTISDRTRQLATQLTAGQTTTYAKAHAIESYLRTFEYDLTVPKPPKTVADVADYFLFDLRRGYCDYYATAFVVLARLAGLPTRFATGYAAGHWSETEHLWIITEAEAHSWPEVYFPDYGWIPFEPTAGRSELARIGLPDVSPGSLSPTTPSTPEAVPQSNSRWNWQLLFWLLPAALLIWGMISLLTRWQNNREDPWQALLRWGQRIGKPLGEHETVLEYGATLAEHIVQQPKLEPDTARVAAREVSALSDAINTVRYGPELLRATATAQAADHWQRLRAYLPRIKRRLS